MKNQPELKKIKFPIKTIIKTDISKCNCMAPHKIKLISNYEVRFCANCLSIKSTKHLSEEDYKLATKDIFLTNGNANNSKGVSD